MKKILKWGAIIFVGLIVIGAIASAGKSGSTTPTPGSSNTNQEQAQQEPAKEPEIIEVSALADAFDANQVAAEKAWKDKYVQFNATISNITDSGISFYNVATKEFSGTQISCRVVDKEQLLSLKNGETVTVKGTVGSQTIGVIGMNDCEVVQ